MTNPLPHPGTDAPLPATGHGAVTEQTAKTRSKTPRRATAPAGAPAKTSTPAIMVLDAAGVVVPSPGSMHDAADSPGPVPAPAAGVQSGTGTETECPTATTGDNAEPDAAAVVDAPAKLSDTARAAAEAGQEGNPNEGLLPQSRRERRQAEEKLDSAVVPGPSGTAAETAPTSGKSVDPAGAGQDRPARKRGRVSAAVRGLLFLLVITAIILGLGTVLSGTTENRAGSSQTEVDRQSAWEAAETLREQATELGAVKNTPAVQELLIQTVNDLSVQGAALGNGMPPAAGTATATATATAPASVEALVLGLRSSGERLLQDAVGADHAMGRVFAAVGTSQLLRSEALAAAADLGAAPSPVLPARVSFPAPSAPECSSTLAPRPGASVDAALLAAAEGEQKAVYAYQVATAHLREPQFKQGTQLLARHEAKLKSLNAELRVRCLPGTTLVPGFALDAGFTTRPAAALASLEGELAAVYSDLAALSTAPATASTATATAASGTTPPATTASEATPGAGAPSANTEQLREMSVAWLLDSAAAQAGWGGSAGALAGMTSGS